MNDTQEKLPYLQLIKGPIDPGRTSIYIEGKTQSVAKSFLVRLLCDKDIDNSDFPVAFDFIFDKDGKKDLTSIKSKFKGKESNAQDFSQTKLPLSHNQAFKIEIKIEASDKCNVIVDGKSYIPCDTTNGLTVGLGLETSKWLHIDGDIELNKVYIH